MDYRRTPDFWTILPWALAALCVAWIYQQSRFGLRLRGAREDEVAAKSIGVNIWRERLIAFVLCLIPFWVSETVRTLGWMILLRESGVLPGLLVDLGITPAPVEMLYHDATILVGLVYTSMLFMVVPLVSALESLDDSLVEAAYDLGGNGWSILRQIVVPHAAPGIAAGSIVVFMLTLGNYLTPTLLGGKNSLWFTEQIYTQFITRFNWEQGAAFGFLLLILSTAIVWAGLKFTGQRFGDVMRRS